MPVQLERERTALEQEVLNGKILRSALQESREYRSSMAGYACASNRFDSCIFEAVCERSAPAGTLGRVQQGAHGGARGAQAGPGGAQAPLPPRRRGAPASVGPGRLPLYGMALLKVAH